MEFIIILLVLEEAFRVAVFYPIYDIYASIYKKLESLSRTSFSDVQKVQEVVSQTSFSDVQKVQEVVSQLPEKLEFLTALFDLDPMEMIRGKEAGIKNIEELTIWQSNYLDNYWSTDFNNFNFPIMYDYLELLDPNLIYVLIVLWFFAIYYLLLLHIAQNQVKKNIKHD